MTLALALFLAQTCVAEISLQPDPEECRQMWDINFRRAERRGETLEQHTRAFNAYWRNPAHRTKRPWIAKLGQGEMPEGWPGEHASWATHRPRWLAYLQAAREWLLDPDKGERCPSAMNYGGIPGNGKGADDPAPCVGATRVMSCRGHQAYWNVSKCR